MPTAPKQAKDGTWTIRALWYSPDGKKQTKQKGKFQKQRDAINWARNYEKKNRRISVRVDKLTVAEFLDEWLLIKEKTLSPNTVRGYKVNIEKIKSVIGNYPLEDLSLIDCQKAINKQEGKERTIRYAYRTLHAALEYACKAGYISSNPSQYVEIPKDSENYTPTILSSDEVLLQLNELKVQEHPLYIPVLISVTTGLRRGEVFGLLWSDIDFKANTISVHQQYTANGDDTDVLKALKTSKSVRICPMSNFLNSELKAWKKEQFNFSGHIEKYVCAIDGKLPRMLYITRHLKAFQKKNGFTVCRFHDLRHSFAMLQLENNTDIKTLSGLLGHSKIGITGDTYLQMSTSLKRKSADVIDALFDKNTAEKRTKSVPKK